MSSVRVTFNELAERALNAAALAAPPHCLPCEYVMNAPAYSTEQP